jgi:hypothetical protein
MDVSVDGSSPASEWHFPFDWNGWGIGVERALPEEERMPGAAIVAWKAEVQAIVEQC